jgi:hypothetical protein
MTSRDTRPSAVEQPLGERDVDDQRLGRQTLARDQLRHVRGPSQRRRRPRLGHREPRRRHELDEPPRPLADRQRLGLGGQRHRLDADDPQRAALPPPRPLEDRRDRPALAPQRHVVRDREPPAVARHHRRHRVAPEHGGGPRIARPRLGVQRLHPGPERGRDHQPDDQGGELHRMPPPMPDERPDDRRPPHAVAPMAPPQHLPGPPPPDPPIPTLLLCICIVHALCMAFTCDNRL